MDNGQKLLIALVLVLGYLAWRKSQRDAAAAAAHAAQVGYANQMIGIGGSIVSFLL